MASAIRIKPESHKLLQRIAAATGQSMQQELDRAIEERRRKVYLEGLSQDYAALKRDPRAWRELQAENAIWDATDADGPLEE